jgi:hypothetical protein
MSTDLATRASHLTLVLAELAQGRDILELADEDGGLQLGSDEGDLLELIVEITDDVIPNYYAGNWPKFLQHFTQSLNCAAQDRKEWKEEGKKVPDTHFTDHIRTWINSVYQVGIPMVA